MKEQFRLLRELQSLKLAADEHQKLILGHQGRVALLEKNRHQRQDQLQQDQSQLEQIKTELAQKEQLLNQQSDRLTRSKKQMNLVTSEHELKTREHEVEVLTPLVESLETNVFELMEKIESLTEQINEGENYLAGSLHSLKEISQEVEQDISKENQAISNLAQRMEALFSELPENIQSKIKRIWDKKAVALTTVEKNACRYCGLSVNRTELDEIDRALTYKFCSSCGRLFLPAYL